MWKKVVLWTLFAILCVGSGVAGYFVARVQVRAEKSLGYMTRTYETDLSDVDLSGIDVKSDKKIVNILVIGNDERTEYNGSKEGGLSDVMMIATLDKKHNKLKLTSLMRDMYVDIPGYTPNKLNSAYPRGGVKLLYKTIAENFGIKLDGYVEVGFKAFVKVVNDVGGVDIELSESEAEYLNTTNYIRNHKYRNVKPGWNHLNGHQALGFCRIRKKCYTVTGITDDYARTYRQRTTIAATFDELKTMPKSKWLKVLDHSLKYVKTDLKNKEILRYLTDVVSMGTTSIDQFRLPMDGYYLNQDISGAGACLVLNTKENNTEALNEFIFEYKGKKKYTYTPSGTTASASPDAGTTDTTGTTGTTTTQY
ncbi:MAG: LCP family protein [Lachnospiraceae bacterium]|nr:LCP family protein [Lachnospiraceae bacterium]